MKLTLPHPDEARDEVAWHRELKQLRKRVAELEAERGIRQEPSIKVQRDGKHGYQCGTPPHVWVLEKEPRVECQSCGAALDAMQVLRDYARHERNFCYSLEHLRKERLALTNEVTKLKSLRLRLRGDVRKLLPRPPPRTGRRKWDRDLVANEQLDRVLAQEPEP